MKRLVMIFVPLLLSIGTGFAPERPSRARGRRSLDRGGPCLAHHAVHVRTTLMEDC